MSFTLQSAFDVSFCFSHQASLPTRGEHARAARTKNTRNPLHFHLITVTLRNLSAVRFSPEAHRERYRNDDPDDTGPRGYRLTADEDFNLKDQAKEVRKRNQGKDEDGKLG